MRAVVRPMKDRVVRWVIATLLAAAAAAAPAFARPEPCGRDLPKPVTATVDGCAAAACTDGPGGTRVCACAGETGENGTPGSMLLFAGGQERQRWERTFSFPVQVDSFEVTLADLDGDGSDELVVAAVEVISNGTAIEGWSLCAVKPADPGKPAVCTDVENYGTLSFLGRPAAGAKCGVLQTTFGSGREPGKSTGRYLVGRWLHDDGTNLVPDHPGQVMALRYTSSVEKARGQAGGPWAWFRDPKMRNVKCPDPLCTP